MHNTLILISRSSVVLEANISVIIIEHCVIEGNTIEIGLTYKESRGPIYPNLGRGRAVRKTF